MKHADALGAQALDVGAVLLVAALDGVALGAQDLGDGAHADAADADDVEGPEVAGICMGRMPLDFASNRCLPIDATSRASAAARHQLLDEIGEPLDGIGRPCACAAAAAAASTSGEAMSEPISLGQALRRQILLLDAPAAARLRQAVLHCRS